jgi:peroxiredoxin/GNAT superfamily N-acetyltransferase
VGKGVPEVTMRQNLNDLPDNLPRPVDDGQTAHLLGAKIPEVVLESTLEKEVNLFLKCQPPTVLFIYPRAGSPLEPNTNPELWDAIPGARGCTPQSCGFRDLISEFTALGVNVLGLSIQSPMVQKEFVERNHIGFPILSDHQYRLTKGLNLPTFEFDGEWLIKRMALFIKDGIIQKVFYPVFPPDKNAEEVLVWLKGKRISDLKIVKFNSTEHSELIEPLTALLHAAYAPLAARGMRYLATHQPPQKTLERLNEGESYLAFEADQLIGTVTLYREKLSSSCEYYRRAGVFSFGQFAIKPEFQGRGFGSMMMTMLEDRARELGAVELALDTSEHADDLIRLYEKRGYRQVAFAQWDVTNYRSVIMSKVLNT